MACRPIAAEDLALVLERTRPLWEEMRGQRLFLTGGTGFFGCWLLESFCSINRELGLGAEAVVLTRDAEAFRGRLPHITEREEVTLLEGDMREFPFPEGEFRYVIHAATETYAKPASGATARGVRGRGVQASGDSVEMFSAILEGTRRVLEFAGGHGARKLLFTSSGAVYGLQPSGMTHVGESYLGVVDPLDPRNLYGEAKRASEMLCALYGEIASFECKIARCWAFCGPHLALDAQFAIGNFVGDALAGRTIVIRGDGTARRSYLYAADLAIWLWTLLFQAPALVPVNVGSAEDLSILELAQTVVRVLEAPSRIEVAREPVPGAPPARYVPSVDRAAEMFGLRPSVTLEEGIRRTADWYRGG